MQYYDLSISVNSARSINSIIFSVLKLHMISLTIVVILSWLFPTWMYFVWCQWCKSTSFSWLLVVFEMRNQLLSDFRIKELLLISVFSEIKMAFEVSDMMILNIALFLNHKTDDLVFEALLWRESLVRLYDSSSESDILGSEILTLYRRFHFYRNWIL